MLFLTCEINEYHEPHAEKLTNFGMKRCMCVHACSCIEILYVCVCLCVKLCVCVCEDTVYICVY